jgi:hypothetical protein
MVGLGSGQIETYQDMVGGFGGVQTLGVVHQTEVAGCDSLAGKA